jgi:hypothetical protein
MELGAAYRHTPESGTLGLARGATQESTMHAQFTEGSLLLRFGRQFGVREAERLSETVLSFAPLSRLTLDFTWVRDFQDSACGLLATILVANRALKVADADALHDALHAITREKPVAIDFHLVRLFDDFAVARLAPEIADRPGHVTLIGLSEHHHRLLRYVGSDQASRLVH